MIIVQRIGITPLAAVIEIAEMAQNASRSAAQAGVRSAAVRPVFSLSEASRALGLGIHFRGIELPRSDEAIE
ncbi:hypothetical protein [Alsobacter sp. SYSU BS001988]